MGKTQKELKEIGSLGLSWLRAYVPMRITKEEGNSDSKEDKSNKKRKKKKTFAKHFYIEIHLYNLR